MKPIQQSKHAQHLYIVQDEDKKFVITMGKYIVSNKKFDNIKEAENYIATKPYEILVNQTQIIMHYEKENETNVGTNS